MNPLNSDEAIANGLNDTQAATVGTVQSPATILGLDNQLLSTGEARLYTKKCSGVYWPQVEADAVTLPKIAATLKMEDGSVFRLVNFHACPHGIGAPNHCEFDYQ